MEPVEITDAVVEHFGGRKVTFKAPPGMENCSDLDVVVREEPNGTVITTAWEPTPDEIYDYMVGNSAKIFIHIWSSSLPPLAVTVEKINES